MPKIAACSPMEQSAAYWALQRFVDGATEHAKAGGCWILLSGRA
jgi:hypothetical protein